MIENECNYRIICLGGKRISVYCPLVDRGKVE